jgi:hypothetical protein
MDNLINNIPEWWTPVLAIAGWAIGAVYTQWRLGDGCVLAEPTPRVVLLATFWPLVWLAYPVIRARRWVRARRERRAAEPLTITVDAATCGESLDYFLVQDASGNVVAKWGNAPGEPKPAHYTPGGSAPAQQAALMSDKNCVVLPASKPVSGHRAWRDDPANFDYLHDGERMWTRYKGVWAASMADVHSMVVCSFRELKGPELDEILREFANRDKSDATS